MNSAMLLQRLVRSDTPPLQQAILGAAIATCVMTLGVLLPLPPLRALIVLPIALLLPGYAAIVAFFTARSRPDPLLMVALSAMLSLAFYPLLALAFYAVSVPLSTLSVVGGTDVMVALFMTAGLARLRATPETIRPIPLLDGASRPLSHGLWAGWRGGVIFSAIVAVIITALAVVLPRLPAAAEAPYTQFYLAGRWSRLQSLIAIRPHQPLTVLVGITNHTHQAQRYQIRPSLDGQHAWPSRWVVLPAGDTWTGSISGPVPTDSCVHQLHLILVGPASRTPIAALSLGTQARSAAPCRSQHSAQDGKAATDVGRAFGLRRSIVPAHDGHPRRPLDG